jgi:hypothetical protein
MKTDVLLLADVFENFRNLSLEQYKLDPAYYYSSPNMAFDAAFKLTGQKLDLIIDLNMYLFWEEAKRGGISQVCKKRYAKSDPEALELARKQMNTKEIIHVEQDKKYIYVMYYDANNLYGHSMMQPLPIGGFKWLEAN